MTVILNHCIVVLLCQWICICFVCCVFVNCLVKPFAICLTVFVILMLNVMELLIVVGGVPLDIPCMVFQRMCILCLWSQCASRCSFHMFCLCFCMSEVISSFRSLRAGSHVFSLRMLFLCVVLHTMSSDKSLQFLCILSFGMLCLSAISQLSCSW